VPLTGPRLPARSGAARQLVVLLHGYGADGNDLIGIGQQWQAFLPDTAFVAPHAPQRCTMGGTGFQWFPLTMRDHAERWNGVQAAGPGVDAFIDAELASHGLDDAQLALVGFSQGAMLALHVGMRRQRTPAAVVAYSGTLEGVEHLKETPARPPMLLVHGDQDDVVPVEALFAATEAFAAAGIPAQWHLSLGIGHGIDQQGLTHGLLFLAEAFRVKVAR
jgi:phospholipase/carboxylesterase